MMVPRSYMYSSSTPARSAGHKKRENSILPVDQRKASKTAERKGKDSMATQPPKAFTPSPPSPSKPVVIPTRTRNGPGSGRKKTRESSTKDRKKITERTHDPTSTPPSVTALLAMTPSSESASSLEVDARRRSFSLARLKMQESRYQATPRRTISSSSPQSWGVLLSPPEESEQESGSFETNTTLGPSSLRSLSSESMPSLEADMDSLSSTSNPATPGLSNSGRMNNDRRQKSISSSVGEDCIEDHPLLNTKLPQATLEDNSSDDEPSLPPPTPSPFARSKSSFKSNLTASFRKIRSAAQSLSAFTAPPPQPQDYIARSLLSPESQFTDERRPLPSTKTPDPALRRYLNPVNISPAELHFHSEESPQVTRSSCTASIQLQTYRRRTCESDKASSPPVFTSAQQKAIDAVDGLPEIFSPRQREPRENSDFLRVIVLEMDMRKKGKLNDSSPGRARLWLPARQVGKAIDGDADVGQRRKIPIRWEGILA